MSKIGASLVWSPRSNLVLYGETTDVQTAHYSTNTADDAVQASIVSAYGQ